jgi:hypothetical protein
MSKAIINALLFREGYTIFIRKRKEKHKNNNNKLPIAFGFFIFFSYQYFFYCEKKNNILSVTLALQHFVNGLFWVSCWSSISYESQQDFATAFCIRLSVRYLCLVNSSLSIHFVTALLNTSTKKTRHNYFGRL